MMRPLTTLGLILILGCGAQPEPISGTSTPRMDGITDTLQGEWVVVSSTGKPDRGHVFLGMVKTPIRISGDTMSWVEWHGWDGEGRDHWIRTSKRIVPRPKVSADAIDLEPDFPEYKTWSRIGIVRTSGDEIHLCVNFPQGPRPAEFLGGNDGREYVVLRRVRTKEATSRPGAAARP